MSKTVLITGATSGIGKACAEIFAKNNFRLILTGRRNERLIELKKTLEEKYQSAVLTLCFDVRKKEEVFTTVAAIPPSFQNIDILINNAGLALGRDNFKNADMDDWDTMMRTNVDGLLFMSRAVIPYLVKSPSPHIINIASIAGKEVYENGNVYCASKFAVDAISKAMRIDLLKDNIKVTSVNPGAVETEFSIVRFKGDQQKADATYTGMAPLTGADIADTIYYCATLPAHVCINEITIMPTQQANATVFNKNI